MFSGFSPHPASQGPLPVLSALPPDKTNLLLWQKNPVSHLWQLQSQWPGQGFQAVTAESYSRQEHLREWAV